MLPFLCVEPAKTAHCLLLTANWSMNEVAIVGGTGVYDLGGGVNAETVATPYGEAAIFRLQLNGREVIFLARHGTAHSVPPHGVNYRANIWALRALGVTEVVATQAVGSIDPHMEPGHFALLGQFLDFAKSATAFFDGDDERVVHIDLTHPYCPRLAGRLLRAGELLKEHLYRDVVYACTEGPRFATAAEIQRVPAAGRRCGGDDQCAGSRPRPRSRSTATPPSASSPTGAPG